VAAIEGPDAVAHAAPSDDDRGERHLLMRPCVDPAQAPDTAARLDIRLEDGVPTAVNDVPMALPELIESLSLIGGQHAVGYGDTAGAPAAVILRAAYASTPDGSGTVRLTLHRGTIAVSLPARQDADLVSRS
jgi:argininosuccinate synthase